MSKFTVLYQDDLDALKAKGYRYLVIGDMIPLDTLELWGKLDPEEGPYPAKIVKPVIERPDELLVRYDYVPVTISPYEDFFWGEIVWFYDASILDQ